MSQYSRRELLKLSLALAGQSLITGCSTLDHLFLGESSDLSSKVVIIGGGLTGLACAYYLKENNIPWVLFEASPELGGQIKSVHSILGPRTWGELGGQWFYNQDSKLALLAKKLFLKSQSWEYTCRYEALLAQDKKLEAYFSKAVKESSLLQNPVSLSQWGQLQKWDEPFLEALDAWAYFYFGLPATHVQASLFKQMVNSKGKQKRNHLTINGGMQKLTRSLEGSVFGPLGNESLKLYHELIEVSPSGLDKWELRFQTPEGKKRYVAQNVIVTLAPELLKKRVLGLESLAQFDQDQIILNAGAAKVLPVKSLYQLEVDRNVSDRIFFDKNQNLLWEQDFVTQTVWGERQKLAQLGNSLSFEPQKLAQNFNQNPILAQMDWSKNSRINLTSLASGWVEMRTSKWFSPYEPSYLKPFLSGQSGGLSPMEYRVEWAYQIAKKISQKEGILK